MNINDLFYLLLVLTIAGLIIYGFRLPLDENDKKLLKEEK